MATLTHTGGARAGSQWLLGLVALVGLTVGAYLIGLRRGAHKQAASCPTPAAHAPVAAPAAPTKPAQPPLPAGTVSAAQVLNDYETNQIAAEQRYNGHPFLVQGTVSAVTDTFGQPALELRGADELGRPSDFFVMNAFIKKESASTAAGLKPGDVVLLQCTQSQRLGEPFIGDCIIVDTKHTHSSW